MLYRMNDANPAGMIQTRREDCAEFNTRGFGIFHTVNTFDGPRRIENLVSIRAWAVDIDEGDKASQRRRIEAAPLMPSTVVESKNGYHAYWKAKDARPEHYSTIVSRVVESVGGDRNARDLARVLRTPGFWHMKDPSHPFMVQVVHRSEAVYTEQQMAVRFPPCEDERRKADPKPAQRQPVSVTGDDFWERVYDLDCAEALRRLSGHPIVSGDEFDLKRQRNGNQNIIVNGKSTSCWIDRAGRIGSRDRGGPTIAQWIRWYGHSYADAARVIRELFPEVVDAD